MSRNTPRRGRDPSARAVDRLLRRTGRHGGKPVWALALTSILLALGETALPAVLGQAVDSVLSDDEPRSWLIWLAVLVAGLVVFDALDDVASGAAIARSTAWLRHTVLMHALTVGTRIDPRFTAGEVATRVVGNAADTGRTVPDIISSAANLIPALGGIVALALIHPWLCLTFLAGMPALALLLRAFSRDATSLSEAYLAVQGKIAARLGDAMAGGRTIAAAGTLSRESSRVLAPLPELHRHGVGIWRAHRRISAQDALLVPLLEVAVLAVAGALLAEGRITPGELLAASQYVLLAANVGSAINLVLGVARGRAAGGRVAELLDEQPVEYGDALLPSGPGQVELHHVTVRNGGRPVLEDVYLGIRGGAFVALVGRSGSGKSLLAALIGRLVDPDEGEVLLDDVPVSRLQRRELRREVAYGFERPVLLGETIGDAIAFGERLCDHDEIVAAARAAQADEFIRRMPAGYDTPLVEAPMSGGEVQRIGLARAFAHAGRVIVLDDVAASLDTVTEHQIGLILGGELSDRTRVIVAHRASTASRADAVVWVDGGGVRAIGPHEKLWQDEDYRALFQSDPQPEVVT